MDHSKFLVEQFEANRAMLRSVAVRILGNADDADDAVQEAWLRLSRSDDESIDNLAGWLTTVVSRICLNTLRSRRRRPTDSVHLVNETDVIEQPSATREEQALLADSVGIALLIVLETLSPAERIAFVLHDTFSVSFEEISRILDKSSEACRQLASRARRRIVSADQPASDAQRQLEVVTAFLAASKSGDFEKLLSLLSPDVELVSDAAAVLLGAPERRDGPVEVADRFSGGAHAARAALLDDLAGLVWFQGGHAKVVFDFTVVAGLVTRIEMIAEHDVLDEIHIDVVTRRQSPGYRELLPTDR